jgi:hypothetical protein
MLHTAEHETWLQTLKVGDFCCIEIYRYGTGRYNKFEVVGLTKTEIRVIPIGYPKNHSYRRFRKKDGREIGSNPINKYAVVYIEQFTKEMEDKNTRVTTEQEVILLVEKIWSVRNHGVLEALTQEQLYSLKDCLKKVLEAGVK